MHRILSCLLFICFYTTLAWADEGQKECPSCLEKLSADWIQALKSGDLEKMVTLYAAGDEVVAVESSGRVRKGGAEVREMYRAAFEELLFHDVDIDFLKTYVQDSYGTTYFTLRAICEIRGNKARLELYVQGTWALRKEKKGGWVIVLEHMSPIFGVDRIKHLDAPDKPEETPESKDGEGK